MNISTLRNLLKKKKVSQREISKNIGMTQAGFSKAILSGDFKVSVLEKIASFLEVPVGYFFDETTETTEIGKKMEGSQTNKVEKKTGNCKEEQNEIEKLEIKIEGLEIQLKLKDKIIGMLENK